jgi:hypothetical protein
MITSAIRAITRGPPSLITGGNVNSKITQPTTKARIITIVLNVEVFMKLAPDYVKLD